MNPQKTARLFGWLFIATFVTSIGAKVLFVNGVGGSFSELRFVPGAVSENSVYLGAILEFGVIVTNIASAVVIYPYVKRQSEKVALGYVAARIMESAFILVGILSIISIVSVSHALVGATGAEATALAVQGDSLWAAAVISDSGVDGILTLPSPAGCNRSGPRWAACSRALSDVAVSCRTPRCRR